ncbi:AMP-binding protein [Cupriavidus oxalaticus]|uniref:AMP-dependent synthetase n=1 Tax=Cupriavidus oxalaticus TaxID=96344 RepID=A0A5P3VCJ5_9BURK|nr:AMP-binding protein [Cupriavidus oxalaticus]QEZ44077.1 AMP-dependent synthetase [Cupriavidus oxalaticus]
MTFAQHLQAFGSQTALVLEDGTSISYAALAREADAVYTAAGAPTRRRTLVAIECANGLRSLAAYLGALRADVPVLLVDAELDAPLRQALYQRYGIAYVHTPAGWQTSSYAPPALHPEVALLLSTSGSTGAPKLVRLSPQNLQANACAIAGYLKLDESERAITSLPMHYSYGLSVINSHLLVGATLVLTSEPMTARAFWERMREREVTSLAGVPAQYAILRQLRFERVALPSLRTMTQAGGRLPDALQRWFGELAAQRGQRFFVMYGQTEATARIAYVPPHRLLEKIGAIGVAIPGGRLELRREDGSLATLPDETGELCYAGANVMLGYASTAADLSGPDQQQGYLRTGDLARRDSDGYFYVTGRLTRFIKMFGNRIGMDEVESQLRNERHDVAVTGRDDLLVVAVRGASPTALEDLAIVISKRYRLHRSAIRVVGVHDFPMSGAGKVRYAELLTDVAPASAG